MVPGKATITLDRAKVARAGALIGGGTMSGVIDIALDRVIRAEELRRDIAAYARQPLDEHDLRPSRICPWSSTSAMTISITTRSTAVAVDDAGAAAR